MFIISVTEENGIESLGENSKLASLRLGTKNAVNAGITVNNHVLRL